MMPSVRETRAARVLIVDDDPTILRLLEFQLNRAGYQVAIAYKGNVVLDRVRVFNPDAILLDLNLPDLSGSELLGRIRASEPERHRAILVLSASPNYDITHRLGDADSVESKPIAPSTLVKKLSSLGVPSRIEVSSEAFVNVHAV